MPYNGSGLFSRVYNWTTDKNNSINITASRMDTETDGIATGLSTCLLKDGTQTVTANIPFANFKLTQVGSGTAATDVVNLGQLQASSANWIAGGGTADAITATYSPAVTALTDGMELDFRATAANATTAPTFSPSGLTARTITKNGGSALVAGDISAALGEYKLRYNLANTRWELMNPAITTLTPFLDTNPLIKGSADATKLFRVEVDGNTTGTTRVMTTPDVNFTPAIDPGGNGLIARTAATTSSARTITGTINQITVSNGDGVSGNPTLSLAFTETTWTPTIVGATSAGTGTYTNQVGLYKRIGNIVFFNLYINWTAHTGTGLMRVGGFPISSVATGVGGQILAVSYASNLASGAGKILSAGFPSGGATYADVFTLDTSGGSAGTLTLDTAGEISLSGFYFI